MTGYILAINLVVAGLFAGAFGWLATYPKARTPALWMSAVYLLGLLNFGIEWSIPLFASPRFVVFAAFATSLTSLALSIFCLARFYDRPLPVKLVASLLLASFALNLAIYDMPRGSALRMFLYQLPYAAIMAVAAWQVFALTLRSRLDTALCSLLAFASVHFLSKPVLAWALGTGERPQDYIDTLYGVISQSMGAMIIVAFGLLVFAIMVHGVLADATEKSETDPLTGLLNRRGFEERARLVGRVISRSEIPASIVICDLDHFKSINDRFGHPAGDRVIVAFSQRLTAALEENHIAGRIGGEEFAVILPGLNAASARLFAEGVRSAFAATAVDGLPTGHRPTASFGVAELSHADVLSDMLRRADLALYEAKNAGRDCVRVAQPYSTSGSADRRAIRAG